jgi:hypothetical protein
MKSKQWIKLIEKNRDEILDKLEEALKQAFEMNMGVTEVILSQDGKVGIATYTSENSMDGDVWNGRAIAIHRFNAQDFIKGQSLDNTDLEDLSIMLKYIPGGLEALEAFQKEHEEFDKYEFLESLPSEISKKLDDVVFENEIDFYSSWFDDYIDERIKEIEDYEIYN